MQISKIIYYQYECVFDYRLLKSGAKLIAIHQARYYKTHSGLSLGPGLFVKGLEYAADCKAIIVGKPSKDFFMTALGDTTPSETVMIGDVSPTQFIFLKVYKYLL